MSAETCARSATSLPRRSVVKVPNFVYPDNVEFLCQTVTTRPALPEFIYPEDHESGELPNPRRVPEPPCPVRLLWSEAVFSYGITVLEHGRSA